MSLFARSKPRHRSHTVAASDVTASIIDRVGHAHLELIPTPKVDQQFEFLPAASTVSVTCSPAKDIQTTLDTAARLVDLGHSVIPHLAARMVEGPEHVGEIAAWLHSHGVREVFIIGGDAPTPHGPYGDAAALMRALVESNSGLKRIGFGGYPDGHISIPDDALLSALMEKQQLLVDAGINGFVSTQMCFDVEIITRWISDRRADGLHLPIHLGIPGQVDATKLLTMGVKLGIGNSLRYLRKNRAMVSNLAGPGRYDPLDLLVPMAADLDRLDIAALHVFTFNQVANTVEWQIGVGGSVAFLDNTGADQPGEGAHRGLSV